MVKFASPSCVCFISFGFLLATICVWVWMVCSLHSVTTGSRDRANVPLIIIMPCCAPVNIVVTNLEDFSLTFYCLPKPLFLYDGSMMVQLSTLISTILLTMYYSGYVGS